LIKISASRRFLFFLSAFRIFPYYTIIKLRVNMASCRKLSKKRDSNFEVVVYRGTLGMGS
jgi:hypothetical protein